MILARPRSTLFPYTTLFRSVHVSAVALVVLNFGCHLHVRGLVVGGWVWACARGSPVAAPRVRRDRKSTRLNSSHANISYAVFCLKKLTTHVVAGAVVLARLA